MEKKKKGCVGCLTSIVAIALAIGLLGSCGGEIEPESTPEAEDPAVVQEQIQEEESSEDVSNLDTEEEPEQEIIELEPVFVDPYGGTEEETPEEPDPEPEAPPAETQQPATPEPEPVTPEPPAETEPEIPAASDPLSGETSNAPGQEPAPEPEEIVPPATDIPVGNEATIVYITETGAKYHHGGCRHLADSKIETTLDAAISAGYTPCGTCH